jgi:membrane protein implicated in regulation of membrane protease activity
MPVILPASLIVAACLFVPGFFLFAGGLMSLALEWIWLDPLRGAVFSLLAFPALCLAWVAVGRANSRRNAQEAGFTDDEIESGLR